MIAVTLFLGICVACCLYLDLIIYAGQPADMEAVEKVVIVRPGQGFKAFSERLYHAGIIKYPAKFRWLARIKRHDKSIKAGEYALSSAMPPSEILGILVSGKVLLYKFTIPEGYNLRQIAALVASSGFAPEADFLKVATDTALVHKMGIDAETFEGYLFPDTYYFPKDAGPETIISTMVKRFWTAFKPEWRNRAKTLMLSVHQVVTLASLIEKETGVAFERPIISSVFHNRLKRHMRLESDPTVIYGLADYDGNITRKHLTTPTSYNTYTIYGLPPGPIASAGIDAIEAALYPADTQFLYFVSKRDYTHQFSTNIKDHNLAVSKYQLRK
ncbi:MAG: endolytic transglycosylase MltG [Desulfobacterales bacterium]|uniref:Endolytic murein transglycosylase n=1 Tax=Candidatus Desulfatibia profunda TaxID=2841695 RepID=A0A8J6NTV1_9BACT|nr:endolytic transglycosylase MltG [Candidatus Desulfatibia profunda]MBL7179264.1 endolytic transglycosylase MltG [Desulfobacterales bacterium]